MVEYLTKLFQNVCDFGWQAAKGAHLVVMTKMEDSLVTWADLKRVNKIRKLMSDQLEPTATATQTVMVRQAKR